MQSRYGLFIKLINGAPPLRPHARVLKISHGLELFHIDLVHFGGKINAARKSRKFEGNQFDLDNLQSRIRKKSERRVISEKWCKRWCPKCAFPTSLVSSRPAALGSDVLAIRL